MLECTVGRVEYALFIQPVAGLSKIRRDLRGCFKQVIPLDYI